jgi:MoaA/NifB/PqqE/SkfB family radical SAM enzyme
MSRISRDLAFARRALAGYVGRAPLCVSFEVTRNCNARCRHCHLGPPRAETLASPERFAEICRELDPVVAQVSGGEPLLRGDVEDIVRGLTRPGRPPVVVLTTNGALLTKERFLRLKEAGVSDVSLSFDYPDERHDEFRQIPGLFAHIDGLMRELSANGRPHGVTLACVMHRDNFRELPAIAERARAWKANVSFIVYTWLRTGNREMLISPDELGELREVLGRVREHKRRHGNVYTSDYVLDNIPAFFARAGRPGCRAGERALVVNPDGTLSPCGLVLREYRTREEMLARFTRTNTCDGCYTSSRANSEKPAFWLVRDAFSRV